MESFLIYLSIIYLSIHLILKVPRQVEWEAWEGKTHQMGPGCLAFGHLESVLTAWSQEGRSDQGPSPRSLRPASRKAQGQPHPAPQSLLLYMVRKKTKKQQQQKCFKEPVSPKLREVSFGGTAPTSNSATKAFGSHWSSGARRGFF